MSRARPFMAGVWTLGAATIFRAFLSVYSYHLITKANSFSGYGVKLPWLLLFIWPALLLLETIIYWFIRNRIDKKLWANIHIACIIGGFILLPILLFGFNRFVADYFRMDSWRLTQQIFFYASWILFGVGHLFFIATIVRSFYYKNDSEDDEEDTGILGEFIT